MNNKSGVACEEGEYKDFTGIIMWGETEGVVENATFVLSDLKFAKAIVFHSGVWENGYWGYGTWESGIWRNGTWKKGIWKGGIWKDGNWKRGIWHGGVWEKGTWRSPLSRK